MTTPSEALKAYLPWNAAIADVVFGEENAGLPVYLDLEEDTLEKVVGQVGVTVISPRDSLIEVVRATLNRPDSPGGIFGGHLVLLGDIFWVRASGEPPPDLGLLAVLSMAAEDMREGDGFASNNYYDRLMPLLGYSSKEDKARIVRSYRDCSSQLWEALNTWLEGFDGDRGLPTAYALTHAHVGRPLSQALVRAADRERLADLFADLHLPPRTHLSHWDMEVLVGEWIDRSPSPASNGMRSMWKNPEARSRIAECALQLLEAWDGRTSSAVSRDAPRRLHLTALLRSFPRSFLELNVVGREAGDGANEVELLGSGEHADRLARLPIGPASGSRWRLLEPAALEGLSLVEGRLRLRRGGATVFERRPRRVVPFRRDDLLQSFVEVERLSLGEPCIVLSREELAQQVSDALAVIARPGFVKRDAVRGCPPGWVLFSDVQVLGEMPERNPRTALQWRIELNVLQPLTSSQLALEGGMRLPGRIRTFSSLSPPEITVVSGSQGRVRLHVALRSAPGLVETVHVETFGQPVAVLGLAPLRLPDGDYEVSAQLVREADSLDLDTVRVRLRSADWPAAGATAGPLLARHLADQPSAVFSADRIAGGARLRGAELIDWPGQEGSAPPPVSAITPSWWSARRSGSPASVAERTELVQVPDADAEDCFHTEAHHMDLPTYYGKRQGQTIRGVCRRCGLVKRYPTRLGLSPGRRPPAQKAVVAPTFDLTSLPPIGLTRSADANVAFDGLCHAGQGRAAALEQVALQVEPSQLYVDRFARGLETLAHLEVVRDPRTFAISDWQVTQSALVQMSSGSFVLAGHRSVRLIQFLTSAAIEMGREFDSTTQTAAPDRIRVRGVGLAEAHSLSSHAKDQLGQELAVVPDAARRLVRVLPPLSSVLDRLPRQPMPGVRSVKRWDGETARWVNTADPSGPGAYQLSASTTLYVLRDAHDVQAGTMARCDARLVKHAAALRDRRSLIGYDDSTETLYMPLGAELPLLYGRVATLASGLLPIDDEEQQLVAYRAVPPDLAAGLMTLTAT